MRVLYKKLRFGPMASNKPVLVSSRGGYRRFQGSCRVGYTLDLQSKTAVGRLLLNSEQSQASQ
jgi:hypothetical protein